MPFKQDRNDELMDALRAEVQFRYEPNFAQKSVASLFLALPALRAFWPMSAVDYDIAGGGGPYTDQAKDLAGGGHHLTNYNFALFSYDNLIPYVEFDGTNDYLGRADGGGLEWADIRGTELYIQPAQRGLTLGGWFYIHSKAAIAGLVGKWTPYLLYYWQPTNVIRFSIHDGGAQHNTPGFNDPSVDTWYFVCGTYFPSGSINLYVNGTKLTNAAGIPAALPDTATDFFVGQYLAGNYLSGRASMCFLCAAALSDAIVGQVFQQSRAMFGV